MSKSISKNIIFKFLLNIFNVVVPIIIGPYVLRVLGPDLMGTINFSQTIYGYFFIFAGFGVYQYGLREISRVRDDKKKLSQVYTSLFTLTFITNILTTIGYVLFVQFNYSGTEIYVACMILTFNLLANIFYTEWVNEGLENYDFITIKTIIIRIVYVVFLFILVRSANDLKEYIGLVLNHLIECGLWDRVRIIADEPNNPEVVKECIEFINSTVGTHQVKYKSATHDQNFLDRAKDEIDDMSINLKLTIQNYKDIESLKKKINDKGGILTWFVCCFPEKPNSFLSSPFVENRIIGWYTYYFGLDGFLRWDYNLWTEDPWKDSSYKFPIWKAGDMFFVYPGKDLKPVRSVRMENLRFGIQDFELFTMLEKEKGREYIEVELMQELLNKKENAEIKGFGDIELGYSLDNWGYDKVKKYVLELLDRV